MTDASLVDVCTFPTVEKLEKKTTLKCIAGGVFSYHTHDFTKYTAAPSASSCGRRGSHPFFLLSEYFHRAKKKENRRKISQKVEKKNGLSYPSWGVSAGALTKTKEMTDTITPTACFFG